MLKRHLIFTVLILFTLGLAGCGSSGGSSSSSGGGGGGGGGGGAAGAGAIGGVAGADLLNGATVNVLDSAGNPIAGVGSVLTSTTGVYSIPGTSVDLIPSTAYPLQISVTGGTFASSGNANNLELKTMVNSAPGTAGTTQDLGVASTAYVDAYDAVDKAGLTTAQVQAQANSLARQALQTLAPTAASVLGTGDLLNLRVVDGSGAVKSDMETLSTVTLNMLGGDHGNTGGLSAAMKTAVQDFVEAEKTGADPVAAITAAVKNVNGDIGAASLSAYQDSGAFKRNIATQVGTIVKGGEAPSEAEITAIQNEIALPTGFTTDPFTLQLVKGGASVVDPNKPSSELAVNSGTRNILVTPNLLTQDGTAADAAKDSVTISWGGSSIITWTGHSEGDAIDDGAEQTLVIGADKTGTVTVTITSVTDTTISRSFIVTILGAGVDVVTGVTMDVQDGNSLNSNSYLMFEDSTAAATAAGNIPASKSTAVIANLSGAMDSILVTPAGSGSQGSNFIVSLNAPEGMQFKIGSTYSANWDKLWTTTTGQLTYAVEALRTTSTVPAGKKTFRADVYKGSKSQANLVASTSDSNMYALSEGLVKKVHSITDVKYNNAATDITSNNAVVQMSTVGTTENFFKGTLRTWGKEAGMTDNSYIAPDSITKIALLTAGRPAGNNEVAGFAASATPTNGWNGEINNITRAGSGTEIRTGALTAAEVADAAYFQIEAGTGKTNQETIKLVVPASTGQAKVVSKNGIVFKKN
ncbi:hypothetical protein [Desulfovibrio sp. JC022]|uniref:hypothetical protein n=1 Tax=Desulfovibrio sp. JC022 TaxID=2593642 RepID=UPI0013D07A9B|nr:hypothetical protein [Desulfovibrio sp. JC022]NDV24926.1 hypothetical protein [Desulfovibrio sp. JC022]